MTNQDRLALMLGTMMSANPAFRSRPIGAPHSHMRQAQQLQIATEDEARALLYRLGYRSDGRRQPRRTEAAREWPGLGK